MSPEAWYTLAVLAAMFVALVREILSADIAVFGALVTLWLSGIIGTNEAVAGFSNPMVLAIGLLFVISAAMRETGALEWMTRQMLGRELDRKRVLARLLVPTAALSGFLNNTPLVAMFAPAVRDWALRHGRSPSRFLMPLSFASILGGTCTLIGTSTNLVVSGLLEERGYEGFGMFELTAVGLPVTCVGIVFLLLFSRRLLPARRAPDEAAREGAREYSVTLEMTEGCPMIGRTVEAAGLRSLSGLFLAEIQRGDLRIVPVRPQNRLREGDRLVLYGVAETVVDLAKTQGLRPVSDEGVAEQGGADRQLFEVVVSATSPLVGQTLKQAGFRRRYDAAVIAIHRNGERLNEKLGEIELKAGDTLMLQGSPGFRNAWANSDDFYLVAHVGAGETPRYALANFSLAVLVGMVVAVALDVADLALAAAAAVILLVGAGSVRAASARNAVDLSVLVIIASAFGISAAVEASGLAEGIASLLAMGQGNAWWTLVGIYLLTMACTEVLSNSAAAALVLPIALAAADRMGVDARPFAVAVALAASLSFLTPFGYQTNLLVYGPGGYRFSDFARLGVPLALLAMAVALSVIPLRWAIAS